MHLTVPGEETMNEEAVLSVVKRNLALVMPDLDPEEISLDQRLADLGCNSIDRADIVTMAMEEIRVTIPVPEFRRVSNIRTLVELLRSYV